MAKKKKKKESISEVRVARPGMKGLVSGVAPEDAAAETAVDMWNLRANQLGRLETRLGYRMLVSGMEGGADETLFMMPSAILKPGTFQVFSVGGTYGGTGTRFYVAGAEKKEVAAGIVYAVHGVLIDNEAVPINLVAINGLGLFKQYYSGANARVCKLPLPDGPDLSGANASTDTGGNFYTNKTYEIRISYYNSVTGEEGALTAAGDQISYSPTGVGVNKKICLTSIPVSTDEDEKDDLYRRIYCKESTESTWYLSETIENNTSGVCDLTEAPNSDQSEPVYGYDPPTPGQFAAIAFWQGVVWVFTDDTIYFNKTENALLFDTATNALNCKAGQPIATLVASDRLWIWGDNGLWYIPRPTGTISADTIHQVKYSDTVLDPENMDTVALCRSTPVFVAGDKVKQVTQGAIGPLGPDYEIKKKVGDWKNRRNFAIYDPTKDRYLLFTVTGTNSIGFSRWICRDMYIFNFQTGIWEKDNYLGLYPVSAMEWQETTYATREILVGGAYGSIAIIEGSRGGSLVKTVSYLYDGLESAMVSGTATGGSTTTVVDSASPFASVAGGMSCAIYRASVDTDGNEYWKYLGVAPVKSATTDTVTFGHSIGFTVAAGDKYYVGAIPWLVKTPALRPGKHLIRQVEIEHAGALNNAILVIPRDTEKETGWMGAETDCLQIRFSDTRTGLTTAPVGVHMACDGPQIQLCGFEALVTISEFRAHLTKLKER